MQSFLAVVTLLLFSIFSLLQAANRPHIIFILADDYGYNDIGYHGRNHGSAMKTPFLDKLAAEGVKLENYYVQPICSPTRSQLMSGRYQIHTGLQHHVIEGDQQNGLPLDNKILPEQLASCGYDTHMVGKWHLGYYKDAYLPHRRGFRTFFGYFNGEEDYYNKSFTYQDKFGYDQWDWKRGATNDTWGQYSAHVFTKKAIEVIDFRDTSKPFFLYLAYQSVHYPVEAPEEYVKPFAHIEDRTRRIYAGMVAALDESVKNITGHLEKVGMLENTIIVFSTDNGGYTPMGGNNWPLRGRKDTLWEGGMKGVGFVSGKPLGVTGLVNNELIHVSDWLPTLLSAVECPILNGTQPLDGFDQWNTIVRGLSSSRTEILHNIDPLYPRSKLPYISKVQGFDTTVHAAIRTGPWKLITGNPGFSGWVEPPETLNAVSRHASVNITSSVQLFHIESDPYEHHELSKQFPDVVDSLLARLAAYNKTAVPVRYPDGDPAANPKYHGGFWVPWVE